ncbi:MAG: hypothetical protein HYR96_02815 [Deltaproteobacteria bacterium]|nr:hypothetical protein [Deltaproteobacteria bacterium]MBI3294033.1 hypothetical protein [Deltaproteobacteria bacterium]
MKNKLSPEEITKLRAETDRLIRSAIAPIRSELGTNYETVIEYLEANEFGLALEEVIGVLVEDQIKVPASTIGELKKIALRMEMEPSSVAMEGLKKLQTK